LECGPSAPADPIDIPMALEVNQRTRAAIVWPADPEDDFYDVRPGADLDLVVLSPEGQVVASSTSLDNTYEIIDFLPAADGQYTLRIVAARCDWSPRYLAWAWWRAG
jgi:hypothetical protein